MKYILLCTAFFLSSCALKEMPLDVQPPKLGLWEKKEVFYFNHGDQKELQAFKDLLSELKAPFLRVTIRYKTQETEMLRQKILRLIRKKHSPKKIEFYKEKHLKARVRVELLAYGLLLPKCPDWSSPMPATKENESLSQLGCAQQTNLGLMLDDPYELKDSESLTPGLGQDAFRSFQSKQKEIGRNKDVEPFQASLN